MAEENTTSANTTAASSKTAPKRTYTKRKAAPKTAAARKAPARQRAPSKSAAVKTVEKVEAKARTYKRRANAYERDAEKAANKLAARARTVSRNAFLASLGFYGKAYDEMQARLDRLQARLDERGKAANVAYAELVKRGSKVEDDAWGMITDIELDALKDRKKLEARLAKARARFNELRSSMGFRSVA